MEVLGQGEKGEDRAAYKREPNIGAGGVLLADQSECLAEEKAKWRLVAAI
jgi:hypothetical protein